MRRKYTTNEEKKRKQYFHIHMECQILLHINNMFIELTNWQDYREKHVHKRQNCGIVA